LVNEPGWKIPSFGWLRTGFPVDPEIPQFTYRFLKKIPELIINREGQQPLSTSIIPGNIPPMICP
jgi:hypothetical protein